jgi:hypothetical protein
VSIQEESRWIATLEAHTLRLDEPWAGLQLPELGTAAEGFRLLWATEGVTQAYGTAGELWWMRLAETVVQHADALIMLPEPVMPGLGLGPAPAAVLPDGPALRDATERLLAASRRTLDSHARSAQWDYRGWALRELADAREHPAKIVGYQDAVAAAQARTLLYRTATMLTGAYIQAQASDHLPPGDLALRLQADLAATVDATHGVLQIPAPPHSTHWALTRSAALAGYAWDKLTTDPAATSWYGRGDPESWLADAAQIAADVAALDATLGPAILAATADPAAPTDIARILRWQVAPDCRAVTTLRIAAYAPDVAASAIPTTAWLRPPPDQLTTTDAPAALDDYLLDLTSRAHDLLLPYELRQLASAATRLSAAAAHHTTDSATTQAARHAVRAWRVSHHAVTQLRHSAQPGAGYGQGYRLGEWADRQLMQPQRTHPRNNQPGQAHTAIAARLPQLAAVAQTTLQHLHATGRLDTAAPAPIGRYVDRRDPDRAGLPDLTYVIAPATHRVVADITHTFAVAAQTSTALAATFPSTLPGPVDGGRAEPTEVPAVVQNDPADARRDELLHSRRGTDWVHWHMRTAITTPEQRLLPAWPEPPSPEPAHDQLLDIIRAAAGPALTQALRDDPALPALTAAAQAAHDNGQDLHLVLTSAIAQCEFGPHTGLASVIAGRIRRVPPDLATTGPSPAGKALARRTDHEHRAIHTLTTRADLVLTEPTPNGDWPGPAAGPRHTPEPPPPNQTPEW